MNFSTGRLDAEALERETKVLHDMAIIVATTKDAETKSAALEACKKSNEAIGYLLKLGTLDYMTALAVTFSLNDKKALKEKGLL